MDEQQLIKTGVPSHQIAELGFSKHLDVSSVTLKVLHVLAQALQRLDLRSERRKIR
jgi:hypothetical protein